VQITHEFRKLLLQNIQSQKNPSYYAHRLNISEIYLFNYRYSTFALLGGFFPEGADAMRYQDLSFKLKGGVSSETPPYIAKKRLNLLNVFRNSLKSLNHACEAISKLLLSRFLQIQQYIRPLPAG
jgi:hypothetical protein